MTLPLAVTFDLFDLTHFFLRRTFRRENLSLSELLQKDKKQGLETVADIHQQFFLFSSLGKDRI